MSDLSTSTARSCTTHRPAGRIATIVEVALVFAACHLTFRAFKHFTEWGRAESAVGLNYSTGLTMMLFVALMLTLHRQSPAAYGLTLRGWRSGVSVGVVWGVIWALAVGLAVVLGGFHLRASDVPPTSLALFGAFGFVLLTFVYLWTAGRRGSNPGRLGSTISALLVAIIAAAPPILVLCRGGPAWSAAASTGWILVGAGVGEEVFFRGYVQSRVNDAFGFPIRILGVRVGVGLLVSSVLFGLIHILNRVDYFAGRYDFSWLWGVMNVCAGLLLGCMREKTGSVLPGAVVHGVSGVLLTIPAVMSK